MISKLVCTDWTVFPEQSAMTIVDGNTLCRSTDANVRGRKRRSCSTVITAVTFVTARWSCEYGRDANASPITCWISLLPERVIVDSVRNRVYSPARIPLHAGAVESGAQRNRAASHIHAL